MSKDYSEQDWEKHDMISAEAKVSWAVTGIVLGIITIVTLGTHYYDTQKVVKEIQNCQNIIVHEFDKARGVPEPKRGGYAARNDEEHQFCLYGSTSNDMANPN